MDLLNKMRRMGVKRKIEVLKERGGKKTRVDKVSRCAVREEGKFTMAQKYTDGERDICCVPKSTCCRNGTIEQVCSCENKESSQWNKNTQTGERDICESATKATCYRMAPPNGCALCERKESAHWFKNTETAKEIFVIRATKTTCCRNGTIERVCSVREEGKFTMAQNTQTGERDICNTCYKNNVL